MARLRYAGVIGSVGSSGLTPSATSHTFTAPLTYANGVTVPTLSSPDYFMLSIYDNTGALTEVVKVTAYNSSSGAATLVRGQDGTSGVSHSSGDGVTTAVYPSDFGTRYWIWNTTGLTSGSVPVTDTTISGMSITIPSSPVEQIAWISAKVRWNGSGSTPHNNRVSPYVDSTLLATDQGYQSQGSSSEYWVEFVAIPARLASGSSHTVTVQWNAIDSTASLTVVHRAITVDVYPVDVSGGIASGSHSL